jgi:hypothetical protein
MGDASMLKNNRLMCALAIASPLLLLAGCPNDSMKASYEVRLTNLTNNQPLSPLVAVLHGSAYHAWRDGAPSSTALEMLAEGGDGGALVTAARSNTAVADTDMGTAPIAPGETEELSVTAKDSSQRRITLATMLVNTNDGFTGVDGLDVSMLKRHESMTVFVRALDAGTEANTEDAATIPGPAAGGEGFNATRDDVDFVTGHAGVVTQDDGLSTSVLDVSYRFDNPVARIVITRVM